MQPVGCFWATGVDILGATWQDRAEATPGRDGAERLTPVMGKEGVMPKEIIRSRDGSFDVAVGWAQDREIQLGVVGADDRSLFWLLLGYDEDAKARLAKHVTHAVDALRDQHTEAGGPPTLPLADAILDALDVASHGTDANGTYSSVWSTIDGRVQVNDLIRLLRKARDSAFGVDA